MIKRFLARFIVDEDGAIGLALFGGLFVAIKYKEHLIWEFWKKSYPDAPRYLL